MASAAVASTQLGSKKSSFSFRKQKKQPTTNNEDEYDDDEFEIASPDSRDEDDTTSTTPSSTTTTVNNNVDDSDDSELEFMVTQHIKKKKNQNSSFYKKKKSAANLLLARAQSKARNLSPFTKKTISTSPKTEEEQKLRPSGAHIPLDDSGILLQGWLKQKQRSKNRLSRLKQWNYRYFCLYNSSAELRSYEETAVAGWGTIPLGEINTIKLNTIQSITTPSHPKYNGCRFDIACRNTKETSKKSKVYSLVADSPTTRKAWVTTIDSRLKRSKTNGASFTSTTEELLSPEEEDSMMSSFSSTWQTTTNTLGIPLSVAPAAPEEEDKEEKEDTLPTHVKLAIQFLEESNPGIEFSKFYIKSAGSEKRIMNATSSLIGAITSTKDLEKILDPVLAGAVIKNWVQNLSISLLEKKGNTFMYPKILEALVMHLAAVAEYAEENLMPAEVLGEIFSPLLSEDAEVIVDLIINAESIFIPSSSSG